MRLLLRAFRSGRTCGREDLSDEETKKQAVV